MGSSSMVSDRPQVIAAWIERKCSRSVFSLAIEATSHCFLLSDGDEEFAKGLDADFDRLYWSSESSSGVLSMSQAVEGIYRGGTIELLEIPQGIEESRVLVTFLPAAQVQSGKMMTFGMFAGSQKSTEADFAIAQFQGDSDDGLNW